MNITVKNITKSYGEKLVLSNFSEEFPECQTTCIMGKSGCGKTTLLKILLGIEAQDSGTVDGMGNKPSVVFQEDRLFEDFSVINNLRPFTDKPDSDIIAELSEVGLSGTENTAVKVLSGGMKRRVAILRSILYNGDSLIMDEPFKGLDAETKQKIANYIKKKTIGKTVITVTHDEREAEILGAANIIVMPDNKSNTELI